jgi:hypothetical protein
MPPDEMQGENMKKMSTNQPRALKWAPNHAGWVKLRAGEKIRKRVMRMELMSR